MSFCEKIKYHAYRIAWDYVPRPWFRVLRNLIKNANAQGVAISSRRVNIIDKKIVAGESERVINISVNDQALGVDYSLSFPDHKRDLFVQRLKYGEHYHSDTINYIYQHLKRYPGDVIHAGALYGETIIGLVKALDSEFFLFEPDIASYVFLVRNLSEFRNVRTYHGAITYPDEARSVRYFSEDSHVGTGKIGALSGSDGISTAWVTSFNINSF